MSKHRRSAEQLQAILEDFKQSGLSGLAYCRQHNLNQKTFYTQKAKARAGDAPVGFVKVKNAVSKPPTMTRAAAAVIQPQVHFHHSI